MHKSLGSPGFDDLPGDRDGAGQQQPGVDRAVPVAAESALADVQQPEGFPRSGRVADIKALGTHR